MLMGEACSRTADDFARKLADDFSLPDKPLGIAALDELRRGGELQFEFSFLKRKRFFPIPLPRCPEGGLSDGKTV